MLRRSSFVIESSEKYEFPEESLSNISFCPGKLYCKVDSASNSERGTSNITVMEIAS